MCCNLVAISDAWPQSIDLMGSASEVIVRCDSKKVLTDPKPQNTVVMSMLGLLAAVFLSISTSVSASEMQDVRIDLTEPETGFRRPDGDIQLIFFATLSPEIFERLELELDAINVTKVIWRKGNSVFYRPIIPLEPGDHQLRLVEYAEDGAILELGNWNFEVRQSRMFQRAGYQSDVTLNLNQRVASENLETAPSQTSLQGGWHLSGGIANGGSALIGTSGLIYQNENVGERDLDLSGYYLEGSHRGASLGLGDQVLPLDNFVIQGFQRRGIKGGWRQACRYLVEDFGTSESPRINSPTRQP